MKTIRFLLALATLLTCLFTHAQNKIVSIQAPRDKINMLVHTPSWKVTPQPVIVFFHGIGERGGPDTSTIRRVEKLGVPKLTATGDLTEVYAGKAFNFFTVSPQLPLKYGDWQPDILESVYEYVRTIPGVDTSRIYVTGLSLGGGGVWLWLQNEKLAANTAAAVIACGVNKLRNPALIKKYQIPIRMYHSADDETVAISHSDNAYTAIKTAGFNAPCLLYRLRYGRHPGGWTAAFNRLHDAYQLNDTRVSVMSPNSFEWLLRYDKDRVFIY